MTVRWIQARYALVQTPNRIASTLIAALTVAAIGWLDLVTGRDIGLSLLYLIPVAFAGWYVGMFAAGFLGVVAAGAWLFAHLSTSSNDVGLGISLWNAFTRLVIYVSQGVMLALLRRDREILHRHAVLEAQLARTDPVTGLPNGRSFLEAVQSEADRARTGSQSLSVLYVDLDNFKTFNDRLGHAAGDDILVEVARVLSDEIGDGEHAARIGGDEFGLLLPRRDVSEASEIGERIVNRVRALASLYPGVGFGATVGISHFTSVPSTASEVVRVADDAMYAGKAAGKGRVVVHHVD